MTRREIIKIICFAAIFLWLVQTVTYITRTNGDVKDRFVGFYAEPDDTIDIVAIGSSPVYPCIVTPKIWGETGITAYTLSTNMQRPAAAVYLVKEALKTQKPGLFVFEMRMYTSEEEAMMSKMAHTRGVTDNLKYSGNRIELINALVPKDSEEKRYTYYFDIFKYHSNWKTMALWSQLRDFRYEYPDDLKGYVIEDTVGPETACDASDVSARLPIEDIQEERLYELLDFLRQQGQDALFIVLPTLVDDEAMAKYNYIADIVSSYDYPFLNMNACYDEIGIDFQTDFQDYGNHTNARGGEKVTAYLEKYLTAHYTFQDKRGDAAYASWDSAYALWQSEYREAERVIEERIARKDWKILGED